MEQKELVAIFTSCKRLKELRIKFEFYSAFNSEELGMPLPHLVETIKEECDKEDVITAE